MAFPPSAPQDLDFTEIEAIPPVHEHPPFGVYAEVVMGRVLDADYFVGWQEGVFSRQETA